MEMSRSEIREKHKKKKRWGRKLLKWLFFLLFLAILGLAGYLGYLYWKASGIVSGAYEEDWREHSFLRNGPVDPSEDHFSLLIIGVDESEKRSDLEAFRSDTLLLATFNHDYRSVKLLSIPRDSYVYIPAVGYETKINHAYAFGGVDATIETVEKLLNVPVDYYVKVNFEAFIEVVDALGGITVDVPYEFTEQDSNDRADAIHLKAGVQRLNGEEALALARTRKMDNDIERGKRQQEIVKAIVQEAVHPSSIKKYPDVLEAVGANMKTNMKFDEMRGFLHYMITGGPEIETLTLEGHDDWSTGTYYYKLDEISLDFVRTKLRQHLELGVM